MKKCLIIITVLIVGCSTEEELIQSNYIPATPTQMGSITDCEGNQYSTVLIGNQEWMAENLRASCYANGDAIINLQDNIEWSNSVNGAWVHYNNDEQYENPYGKLYNWYVTIDPRNACPQGWHVPTDAEWSLMIGILDPLHNPNSTGIQSEIAGGKMKQTGTQYWASPNVDATNESGLTILPGGIRDGIYESAGFGWLGESGLFWSSSEDSNSFAYYRHLYRNDGEIGRGGTVEKDFGYSIRCIKD